MTRNVFDPTDEELERIVEEEARTYPTISEGLLRTQVLAKLRRANMLKDIDTAQDVDDLKPVLRAILDSIKDL